MWAPLPQAGTQDHRGLEAWVLLQPRGVVQVGDVAAQRDRGARVDESDLGGRAQQHQKAGHHRTWGGSNRK